MSSSALDKWQEAYFSQLYITGTQRATVRDLSKAPRVPGERDAEDLRYSQACDEEKVLTKDMLSSRNRSNNARQAASYASALGLAPNHTDWLVDAYVLFMALLRWLLPLVIAIILPMATNHFVERDGIIEGFGRFVAKAWAANVAIPSLFGFICPDPRVKLSDAQVLMQSWHVIQAQWAVSW